MEDLPLLNEIFGSSKTIIGVVHLLPLPGSSRWRGDMQQVLEHAKRDADALSSGGVDGIIVENFGDIPLHKGQAGPETVSSMTLAVEAVKRTTSLPLGINVLRNDASSAMAIAYVTGASFIRVNVHTGVMVTDEGIIEGQANETLRLRQMLGARVKIFADVLVKHAVPLGNQDLWHAARTASERGLADALIVSGPMTGEPTAPTDVETVRNAVPDLPLLIGSGVDESNVEGLLKVADGAIVGTSLKKDGQVANPVDPERVWRLVEIVKSVRG